MPLPIPALLAGLLIACSGGGVVPTEAGEEADPTRPPVADPPVEDRVIVLVAPGVDPDLVERWRSDLPAIERFSPGRNLSRLQVDGPAAADHVAAQLVTGRSGGAHGVIGGVVLSHDSLQLQASPTWSVAPFWETAARAGVATRVLWSPGALPVEPIDGLTVVPERLHSAAVSDTLTFLTPGATQPAGAVASDLTVLTGEAPWTVELPLDGGLSWTVELSSPRPGGYRLTSGGVRADVALGEVTAPVALPLPEGAAESKVQVRLAAVPAGEGAAISLLAPGRTGGADSP